LKEAFESSEGFSGKEILVETESKVEIAMNFETKKQFHQFCDHNELLLQQRSGLINEWCKKTGQTYTFYFV